MKARVVLASSYHRAAWKNGGGITSEIASMPTADGRFVWRVSVAEVEKSGEFSDFSGYDRVIAVADGAGMHLSVAGRASVRLTQDSDPYEFPGAAPTTCTLLAGPIRDFNLIFDPSLCKSAVIRLRLTAKPTAFDTQGRTVLIYAPQENLTINDDLGAQDVPAGASYIVDGTAERLLVAGPAAAAALVTTIEPAGGFGMRRREPC